MHPVPKKILMDFTRLLSFCYKMDGALTNIRLGKHYRASILDEKQRKELASAINDYGMDAKTLSSQTGINVKTLRSLANRANENHIFRDKRGRPRYIDAVEVEQLHEEVKSHPLGLRVEEVEAKILELAAKSVQAAGISDCHMSIPSNTTVKRIRLELGVKKGTAETGTAARFRIAPC